MLPIEGSLGFQWCIESDVFEFHIVLSNKPPTRRGILSTISSVYDPLGFAAPFILPAKKILNDLCREDIGWDDKIPDEYMVRWERWLTELPSLQKLQTPRCVKPPDFRKMVSQQIHIFSDASVTGYAAVAYLRLRDDSEHIHCSFLMGRARLAPMKIVTIPRLELTATAVSVSIGELLKNELDEIFDVKYHTNSPTVLRYIINEQQRFHVFVANRVQLIHNYLDPSQWRYVETDVNPADDALRGTSGERLLQQRRWFEGPEFIWKPEQEWPQQPVNMGQISNDDPEIKPNVDSNATTIDDLKNPTNTLIHLASFEKSRAVFLRTKKILRDRIRVRLCANDDIYSTNSYSTPFSAEDLAQSETTIVKFIQSTTFPKEKMCLSNIKPEDLKEYRKFQKRKKMNIKKVSSIYRPNPYLEDGILKVGGRLNRAELTPETPHPIVLPYKNHVTTLIIRQLHRQMGHLGRNHVSAAIREKYWVIMFNAAVRQILSKCVFAAAIMERLPSRRWLIYPRTVLNQHLHLPIQGLITSAHSSLKERRKELKRYGEIFTCLVSRAVHTEIANSLDADSFILALRRFIARRGPVWRLRNDNGSNFVGANKELRRALEEMDQNNIRVKLRREGIEWRFNPPSASHMGGVWERQIRSTRKVLAALMHEHGSRLDEESLRTLICEVEAVINSKPLTIVSNDPSDLQPLTPNHILTTRLQ